ncbi:MAG: LytTR family DNA-binding domain-containing protein [Ferruginibacter sp.]
MRILVAEDEKIAAKHLINTIDGINLKYETIDWVKSVAELKKWLASHPVPDLMFLDIQLQDGKSLQIFDECKISSPVIFVTAYDNFIINSFKANSLSYILKPIQQQDLESALQKYNEILNYYKPPETDLSPIKKERIIVRKGAARISIPLEQIAFFYSEMKLMFVVDFTGERFFLDYNLSEIEKFLNKKTFFRITRQVVININAVLEYKSIEFSKIEINLFKNNFIKHPIIISQFTAPDFKRWIESL